MQLMPGETILITGGAGMVGQAAAAIARWRGAEPIIAGRTHKPDGAGHFIDTTSTDMREAVLELTGGRAPTWPWTPSAAPCSSPLCAACGSAAG